MAKSKKCPTKFKRAYDTREGAQDQVNDMYRRMGKVAMVHPYKCKCGKWHVGGRRKAVGRRT